MLCGMEVFEFSPSYMNIDRSSPCFAGFDPSKGVASADLGLLLDVDVPWLPKFIKVKDETRWVHIDIDTIKKDFPMWGFASDMRVNGDCATILRQIAKIVRAKADKSFYEKISLRIDSWRINRAARKTELGLIVQKQGDIGAISSAFVCAAIGEAIDAQDIVINEAIRNSPAVLNYIPRSPPPAPHSKVSGRLRGM